MDPLWYHVGSPVTPHGAAADVSGLEHDSLAASSATSSHERRSLMSLPTEVRMSIYHFLFKSRKPIPLDVDGAGAILFTRHAELSLQFLRVSKTICVEASPVFYRGNTFLVNINTTARLVNFRQPSRMCIEHVRITSRMGTIKFDSGMHDVDMHAIGQTFPYLQRLDMALGDPSTLLLHALKLSNSLPCSPLREWPLLEVIVDVPSADLEPDRYRYADTLFEAHEDRLAKKFMLDSLSSGSMLKLGREMPELVKIQLRGELSTRLRKLLDRHVSSFGDCRFEKASVRKANPETRISEQRRYVWKRDCQDVADRSKAKHADMHRWVPKLGHEWHAQLLESGCTVERCQKNEPVVRAAKQRRSEDNISVLM